MLLTPDYLRNEKQIHGHGSQGPHDPVPMWPLSSHTVFSSKQICISYLVTSKSLLFTTLGLHTFCLVCCDAGLSTYTSRWLLHGISLDTTLLTQVEMSDLMPPLCLEKVLRLCNILLDCTVSSPASLTRLCTSEPT